MIKNFKLKMIKQKETAVVVAGIVFRIGLDWEVEP